MLASRSARISRPSANLGSKLQQLPCLRHLQTAAAASQTLRPTLTTRTRTTHAKCPGAVGTTSPFPTTPRLVRTFACERSLYHTIRQTPRAVTRLPIATTPRHSHIQHFARPFTTSPPPYSQQHTQSATGTWISVLIVGIVSGSAYLYRKATKENNTEDDEEVDELNDPLLPHISAFHKSMTGETLPGRPGTLTPEQDEKLRIFWIAVLHVFGVIDHDQAHALNSTVHGIVPELTRKETAQSEKDAKKKKDKKSHGWFSRHKEEKSEDSQLAEDKYGQTAQFKHALASMKPETMRKALWSMVKHDNPDALLLRFLRARKWDVEKALVMMVSTMHWRAEEMHVDDDIVINGEEQMLIQSQSSDPVKKKFAEDFLAQVRTGKSYIHGEDYQGRPMCFVRVRLHHAGDQGEEAQERYTVYIIEQARALLNPPVDTCCIVFDMNQFSLANMDYAPVKFMIKVFEANYPESLGVVLIHKAPWIFQGIWKVVRSLLDPVVAQKVNFTNTTEDLAQFVDLKKLPKDIGGSEDWEYKYVEPVVGENDAMKDTASKERLLAERAAIAKEYEERTIEWIEKGGSKEVYAQREELRLKLKANYWQLDPYVRARSYYDRICVLSRDGVVDWSKSSQALAAEKPAAAQAPVAATGPHAHTSADDLD